MKIYLPSYIFISIAILSCNDHANNTIKEQEIDSAKEIKHAPHLVKMDTAFITELSVEELKDDKVFADSSKPSSWETAGITDPQGLKIFIKQLQSMILNNDREQLAKQVRYPLNANIKTEENFLMHFDDIFTAPVRSSIIKINFSQLFRNYHGVMTEGGKVWIRQFNKEFKIIAINS